MHRIDLTYALRSTLPDERRPPTLHHPLFALLDALHRHGSIRAAAQALELSYRHVWGELKRWEGELGRELVLWAKGQRAALSPFGEKLLWAERRAQARLAPQVEALRMELERAFDVAFDDRIDVMTLCASHDQALPLLRELAREQGLHLDLNFMDSLDALRALDAGQCTMAGIQVRDGVARASVSARIYRPRLKPGHHKLIGFAQRTQGLMVAPGNPRRIAGLSDMLRPDLRWVGRAEGTGTRILLDELLAEAGVHPPQPALTEPSHVAAAQAVASGSADAAFGLEAAARPAGLDFIPLARERYFLLTLKSTLDSSPALRRLVALLGSTAWAQVLAGLPGYAATEPGAVLALTRVLPWWSYRKPAAAALASASSPVAGRHASA